MRDKKGRFKARLKSIRGMSIEEFVKYIEGSVKG